MKDHLQTPFDNLAEEFRRNKKGRKRRTYLKSDNMFKFIQEVFTPQWTRLLDQVSMREREIGVIQKGMIFVWVQLLKDVRRFYRFMFKLRFHRSDKRKDNNRRHLINWFISELGMTIVDFDENETYNYFYPVLTKLRKDFEPEWTKNTPISKIFTENNFRNKDEFLSDALCSQLLWFFLFNFSEEYLNKMNYGFKDKVQNIIKELISMYRFKQE